MTAFLQPLHAFPLFCPTLREPGLLQFCCVGMLPVLLPFYSLPTLVTTEPFPLGTLPGLNCWSRDGDTEPLAWLHQHLFPLAVPVAPRRLPAHKKRLSRAKLEGDCATSITVSPTPALGDPTAMVHREMTGVSLVCMCVVGIWSGLLSGDWLGRSCGRWAVSLHSPLLALSI